MNSISQAGSPSLLSSKVVWIRFNRTLAWDLIAAPLIQRLIGSPLANREAAPLLSRRNAGLPALDALDSSLLDASLRQRVVLAVLPFASLALLAGFYALGWYVVLPALVILHFITSVTYLHDVTHGSAGLTRAQAHWVMFVASLLLLQSGHSFRYNHMFHHAHCLAHDDIEGAPAHMSLFRVLLAGPSFLPRMWRKALLESTARERRWVIAELAGIASVALIALVLVRWTPAPLLYCAAIMVGSWLYPIATTYLPHYKPGKGPLNQARTLRGVIVPALFLNLTYHLEHHLYPQVPSFNLPRLSRRLDPHLAARGFRPTQAF